MVVGFWRTPVPKPEESAKATGGNPEERRMLTLAPLRPLTPPYRNRHVNTPSADELGRSVAPDEVGGPAAGLPRVHLASRSARRRQILGDAGIEHTSGEPGLDDGELEPGDVSPEHWVVALAYLKARTAARDRAAGEIVLGADTVVVFKGRIIGQPRDGADAERIIRLLAGADHDVVTGVALVHAGSNRRDIFVERAEVTVGEISDEEIARYIGGGGWRGKAGAYNLSERIEAGWPIRYRGDPNTIMGLPLRALLPRLRAFARVCGEEGEGSGSDPLRSVGPPGRAVVSNNFGLSGAADS